MDRRLSLVMALAIGLVLGVGFGSWRLFPTEDMIARATCAKCHDVHGSIEWRDAPFQSQVWILGDVPEATYLVVNDLFPYREGQQSTGISLPELLAHHGAPDYSRVALESLDGGIVILEQRYLTEESVLVPYMEGIRFKDQNQHVSTWLKGVRWIIVEGRDRPLLVAGERTSMGRLLLADRTTVITEGGDAIYKSPLNGEIYRGNYAHTVVGARLASLVPKLADCGALLVRDRKGQVREISCPSANRGVIATVDGRPALVLPDRPRRDWVLDVVEITPLGL